jgi:hypothetical protein
MTDYSFYKDGSTIEQFIDRITRLRDRITRIASKDTLFPNYRDKFLSSEAVARLLFYSYYASLKSDEGRQTTMRFLWSLIFLYITVQRHFTFH